MAQGSRNTMQEFLYVLIILQYELHLLENILNTETGTVRVTLNILFRFLHFLNNVKFIIIGFLLEYCKRLLKLWNSGETYINPLKTKRRLLYLKTQFVPRSKHFSSWLQNQSVYAVSGKSRCLFSDKYKTHKYSVGRTYSC